MRGRVLVVWLWSGVVFGQEDAAQAEPEPELVEEEAVETAEPVSPEFLEFADQLLDQGLYSAAYVEYLRFARANRETLAGDRALYRAGRAVSGLERSAHYRWSADQVLSTRRPAFMLVAQNERYRLAVDLWELGPIDGFIEEIGDPDLAEYQQELTYMHGWIQLADEDYSEASSSFSSIEDPDLKPHAQATIDAIESRSIPRRSKGLAMALSAVLPGSGIVYGGGEASAGATMLALTGLTGWATWQSYAEGQHPALTSLSALSFISVYITQLGASSKAAESFNKDEVSRWFESVHDPRALTISVDPTDELRLQIELPSEPELEASEAE